MYIYSLSLSHGRFFRGGPSAPPSRRDGHEEETQANPESETPDPRP